MELLPTPKMMDVMAKIVVVLFSILEIDARQRRSNKGRVSDSCTNLAPPPH